MLKKKRSIQGCGETIIGQGTAIEGNIKATGLVRIDGKIEGTIETQGDLVVGTDGIVNAQIQAENVVVAGQVHGAITASGRLEIGKTGKLYADAQVGALVIEEGALFQGQCQMAEHPPGTKEELFRNLQAEE